jgi:uncharacterized protein (TIGR03083 family)
VLQDLPPADVDPGARSYVKNPIGQFNEREVESRRGLSGPEVLAELEDLVALRLATLRSGDDAYFAQERMTPTGPGTMLDFLNIRILDCFVHEQDIRRAVGRPGHLGSAPAGHTIDRLIRTLPIVVGKRAAAPEGSTCLITVSGPTARTIPIRVEGGRAKIIEAVPDDILASVDMDTDTFLVLAVGRQSAAARADRIHLDGNQVLGQAIVDNINMMI